MSDYRRKPYSVEYDGETAIGILGQSDGIFHTKVEFLELLGRILTSAFLLGYAFKADHWKPSIEGKDCSYTSQNKHIYGINSTRRVEGKLSITNHAEGKI